MLSRRVFIPALVVLAVPVILLFSADSSSAARSCVVFATKSAPGAGDYEFLFKGVDVGGPFEFTVADGGTAQGTVVQGTSSTITEAPQDGYRFGGIECDSGSGIVITEMKDGFKIDCNNGNDGTANCIIYNVLLADPIPTLSEWGMLAAAAGLGLIGLFFAARRRKAVA